MDLRSLKLLEYDKVVALLAAHASSSLAKEMIMRMRPGNDIAIIQGRLQETTEARYVLTDKGHAPFGGLHDVKDAIIRSEKQGVLSIQELLDISDTAACSRRLRRFLLTDDKSYAKLQQQARLLGEFKRIEDAIGQAISGTGEVVDSASPELDRSRSQLRHLNMAIQRELQRIVSSPGYVDHLQEAIVTQRNGRFCVPVRAESRNAFKGIVHDISASGQTVFMEPLTVVDLGNDLREAQRREQEEVERVLAKLSAIVGAESKRLQASIETAVRLDAIFARAEFAQHLDATEPELNTEGIVDVQRARHPLLGTNAVPIDIILGGDGTHTLLITGPNTGGKTVTLKTVGLLCMMAQSGMHVPTDPGSRLAVFSNVFADIGDEQSIEQSLSTFSGHMTNIVRIINEAQPNTLVLLDELGAGTDPAEGAALGKAILLELKARGCRTIATTHYGELKVFGQNTEGFLNASVEFDLETLRPTYRVIIGLPGSSNAFAISQRLGLPKAIVTTAKEMMGEAPQAMEQVLKQAEGVRRALDRERTAAAKARKEAEAHVKHLREEQREFDEKRDAALAKAREKAQDVLQRAREEANALLDELRIAVREANSAQRTPSLGMQVGELRKRSRDVISSLSKEVGDLPRKPVQQQSDDRPALEHVKAGQPVYIKSLGHRGTALEEGHSNDEIEVQVGIMRVRVAVNDLEARGIGSGTSIPASMKEKTVPQVEKEILLLGKRAEEAANELESYLYDALEAGLHDVRIVHGFGTGALRQVVQDVLRHHPAVKRYRMGDSHEGGGGVTVATIGGTA